MSIVEQSERVKVVTETQDQSSQPQLENATASTANDLVQPKSPVPVPVPVPKKKSLGQKVAKEAMMMTRRIHLFSGLFMFPWVLLYGFTGWFFNHPTYFSSDEVRSFSAQTLLDDPATQLPDPAALASRVVEEINLESFMVDGPEIELTGDMQPAFDRYLSFNVNTDEQTHRIEIHPVTGDGIVRTTAVTPTEDASEVEFSLPTNPLASVSSVNLAENTQTIAQEAVPELLSALGLSSGEAFTGRFSPSLKFSAIVDGRPCKVSYNLGNGSITALADDAPASMMSAKAFSQRLHLARGYAPSMGVRTWWAISVDAMFLSMVFWGLSGIFMWWQIKRTRKLGFAILTASALCAVYLVVGMHEELGARERGRGNNNNNNNAAVQPAAEPQASEANPKDSS